MGARMWHGDRITKPFPPINQSVVPESAAASPDRDLADMAAETFVARAKECFDVECERPMQSLVNGLLLMASFNSGRARPNLGCMSAISLRLRQSADVIDPIADVIFNCAVASSHAVSPPNARN